MSNIRIERERKMTPFTSSEGFCYNSRSLTVVTLIFSCVFIGGSGRASAQSSKGKTKDIPKAKFNVLSNDEWGKYQDSLAGDGGPIAKEKVVTLSLSGGKVVSEVAVNEVVLGPVDGLFQSVTVIEGDGKKKQPHKYSAALVRA